MIPLQIIRRIQWILLLFILLVTASSKSFSQASCPEVLAGPDVSATCTDPCVNLSGSWTYSGATTDYVVFPVPYAPYSFNTGTPIIVNIDDIWSSTINLPFNFCFYGINYNQVVIGANGLLSFDISNAGGPCQWVLQGLGQIPSTNFPTNSIMGVYQDIDPTNQGSIYYLLTGTAPCRKLIVSYYQVPYYGDPNSVSTGFCGSPLFATMQIVLYETTNVIDMFIESKPYCSGWNGGLGIQGIQNAAGTVAHVVPGRNNTQFSATNDGVRFIPFGPQNVSFAWLDNTGSVISTTSNVQVCPSVPTTYTAQATYTQCNGTTVVITDDVVVSPASTLAGSILIDQPLSCPGANDAVATASASGGAAPYTYQWSGGATTATVSGLSAGTHTVTITESGGCVSIATITITNPPGVTVSQLSQQDVSCAGGNNGVLSVTVSGGAIPYQYLWNNGNVTSSASGLSAGSYTVTVTDNNGCTAGFTGTISEPTAISIAAPVINNASCFGLADGSVSVSPGGGAGSYQYAWSPSGGSSSTAAGLGAGTYTVVVTDNNGCTASISATVNEPSQIQASLASSANVSCNGGNNGSLAITSSGGTGGHNYAWSPSGGTNATASSLAAGTYSVLVTDQNGCMFNLTNLNVTQPQSMTVQPVQQDVSCGGGSDGSISLTVSNGTAPYQFAWSNGGNTNSISALTAGVYNATITDNNGCTISFSATITEPLAITVTGVNVVNPNCAAGNDGSLSVNVAGGVSPYQYLWSNGSTVNTASNLIAGNYTVTITDDNGCTLLYNASVTDPAALTIAPPSVTDASCFGLADGSVSIVAAGGTGAYSYAWSPSGGSGATAGGLIAGNYTAIVTDLNGCTASITATVNEPAQIQASITNQNNVACNGGNDGLLTVNAAGGAGGYTYAWSPSGGAASTANGLAAGTYSVLITDQNGCTVNLTNLIITEPQPFSILAVQQDVLCFGGSTGSLSLTVSNGTAPYQFAWSNGGNANSITGLAAGNYTATITDNNGCTTSFNATIAEPQALVVSSVNVTGVSCFGLSDGSVSLVITGGVAPYQYTWNPPVAVTATAINLSAGNYDYQVSDANGCYASGSATVNEPAAINTVLVTVQDVSCNGGNDGSLSVNVSGGVNPYTYAWSPSGGNAATAIGLVAGTYSVLVTDQSGCTFSLGNMNVGQPQPLVTTPVVDNVSCPAGADGVITVAMQGGTAPYSFAWNNGATSAINTGLSSGTYTLTVTDQKGCITSLTQAIAEPSAFVFSSSSSVSTCNLANGSASVTVAGGTSPYQYLWSDNSTNSQLSAVFAGNYSVTVTDSEGCTASYQLTIGATALPVVSITGDDSICEGNTGIINAVVQNAVYPMIYSWSGGLSTSSISITPTATQTYTVLITDGYNCTSTASKVVVVKPAPSAIINEPDQESCLPFNLNFSAVISPSNSTFIWDFGDQVTDNSATPNHAYTTSGVFDVTLDITSPQGCTGRTVRPAMITIYPDPVVDFVIRPDVLFESQPVAYFQNISTGAIAYWWDFGDASPVETIFEPEHFYKDTGNYVITLIGASDQGCRDTMRRELKYLLESTIYIPSAFTPNNDGKNDQFGVAGIELKSYNLSLYNRWGQRIFSTNDINAKWDGTYDGTESPAGVYVYHVTYMSVRGKQEEIQGRVTLYR